MSAGECSRHREALAELAEHDEATPAGTLALDHVARCPVCAEVLGDLMLTVVALRRVAVLREWPPRAAAAPGGVEHALDTTWARLRDRIEQSHRAARDQAWRWRTSLGGVLASALVVGALVGPATVGFGPASVDPVAGDPEVLSWQIEIDYVSGAHSVPINESDAAGPTGSIGFRRYPDDLRPVKKEVAPARSSGLAPDAR